MYVVPARAYCNSFFIVRAKFIQQHYNKTKTDKNYQEKKIKTILRSSPWSSSIVFEYERIISLTSVLTALLFKQLSNAW